MTSTGSASASAASVATTSMLSQAVAPTGARKG